MPATISTSRRGTHLLKQSGRDVAYLESSAVLLRDVQGRLAVLRGVYERNIDASDLPVFVVSVVASAEEATRDWQDTAMGIRAVIPSRWGVSRVQASLAFIPAGSLMPIVSVAQVGERPVPSGVALTVGGAPAIRFFDDISGEQRIAVPVEKGYIEIAYTPKSEADQDLARAEWLAFLRSIRITRASAASQPSPTSSSAFRDRSPCGGIAGILCPSGQFCEITDLELNIGVCRSTKE